jgi:beta-ureidopropionase
MLMAFTAAGSLVPAGPPPPERVVGPRRDSSSRRLFAMPRIVRGALLQATWTGDKESMIQKHEQAAHDAKAKGAQVMLFQELFYGPYFCQVQEPEYFSYTELIPDGPTTKRMQSLAKELGMVLIVPMYEEDSHAAGIYYNTAAVIDADGKFLGKYRKTHIPHVKGFWEKYYFRPGNLGYPVFETAVGRVGVYICYDRHFPEGARALGLNGAEMVFIPSATSRGLSEYLWRVEQVSHALANGYFVGTINRVGIEPLGDDDFYGQSYFVDPKGQFIGGVGSAHDEELIVRDMDLDMIHEVRNTWQFYRDRRPEMYGDLVKP